MAKNKPFPYLRYFKRSEFDSPDAKNSYANMNHEFVMLLDKARHLAKTPFIITSGFRTVEHNKTVGGLSTSSHLKGCAVDIDCSDSKSRFIMIYALLTVGFNRIGIGKDFIHVDMDQNKPQNLIWHYYK